MKRILYVDLLSPVGHVNYDMNMLRLMKNHYEVDVIIRQSMLSQIPDEFYHLGEACPDKIFPDTWTGKITNRLFFVLKWRFYQFSFIKSIIKNRCQNYDYIFFSSIDIYSFAIASLLDKNRKLTFVDHGIYRLKGKSVRFFYKYILNKNTKIIALEEYIAHHMKESGVLNNIFVIHHPLPKIKKQQLQSIVVKDRYFVFAPSTSNDEFFINDLITQASSIPSNVSLQIRSNSRNYNSDKLIVYNKRIAIESFDNLFEKADYILLPYESSYNYRTSAILFESLSKGKRVLLWGNNTLMEYFKNFPNCVCLFNDVKDLLEKLNRVGNIEYDCKEISCFLSCYSDDYITEQIKKAFENYI